MRTNRSKTEYKEYEFRGRDQEIYGMRRATVISYG